MKELAQFEVDMDKIDKQLLSAKDIIAEEENLLESLNTKLEAQNKILEHTSKSNKQILDLKKQILKNEKEITKAMDPSSWDKFVKKMKQSLDYSKGIASSMKEAVTMSKAFVATGIGAVVAGIGKVFSFISDMLEMYQGSTDLNLKATELGISGDKLKAIQTAEGIEGERGYIQGVQKFREMTSSFDSNSLLATFGIKANEKDFKSFDEYYDFVAKEVLSKINEFGGMDGENSKGSEFLRSKAEDLGFSRQILLAQDKRQYLDKLSNSKKFAEGVRTFSTEFGESKEKNEKKEALKRGKTKEKIGKSLTALVEKISSAMTKMAETIEKVWDWFSSGKFIGDIKQAFAEAISGIWNGISGIGDKARNLVNEPARVLTERDKTKEEKKKAMDYLSQFDDNKLSNMFGMDVNGETGMLTSKWNTEGKENFDRIMQELGISQKNMFDAITERYKNFKVYQDYGKFELVVKNDKGEELMKKNLKTGEVTRAMIAQ